MNQSSRTPVESGGSDTRDMLLAEARRAFAQQGYDGASIRQITTAAAANLGAVTYHFGTKRQLYGEVLTTVLGPLLTRVQGAAAGSGNGLERVLEGVRVFFVHLEANPDQPGLMMQELASGRTPPEPAQEIIRAVFGTFARMIEDGQRDGSVRPGDPALLTLSSVAQPIYLSLVRRLAAPVLQLDVQTSVDKRNILTEHALGFVRRGLVPDLGGAA